MLKKYISLFAITLFFMLPWQNSSAQVNNIGEFVRAGTDDASLLLENYLRPYTSGFGANLNTGWNNSARPYRTLGFDIRISGAMAFVPASDEVFDVASLEPQFQELELFSSSGITPTIAGDDVSGVRVGRTFENPQTNQTEELFSFNLPRGTGFPLVPSPMIQGTIGIPNDTDISLRIMPSVSPPDVNGQVSLFGIGAKHGLNQWLPGGTVLPIDLSVQIGYTRFNFDIDANVQPESGGDIYNRFENEPEIWDGQQIELQSAGYTANLLVGRNLPILSVFAGVGFQSSTTEIATRGAYPLTVPNTNMSQSESKAIERIDDPISISSSGDNSIHALAGFRVRLGFIAFSGSYTISEYPVANIGVGISMR